MASFFSVVVPWGFQEEKLYFFFSERNSQNLWPELCDHKGPEPTDFLAPPARIDGLEVSKGTLEMFRPGGPRFGLMLCDRIEKRKKCIFFRSETSKIVDPYCMIIKLLNRQIF